MSSPRPQQHESRNAILLALALAGLVFLLYAQVWNHEFVNYDDDLYILDNVVVRDGLSWDGVQWAFTSFRASNWHPLTWISHMIDCELFGVDPTGHHLVNVSLHTLNAVLLFLLLRAATGTFWPSALVAALFAVHPLRVESVAWAAERKDLLAALFWNLAFLAYVRYVKQPGVGRYALVFAALAAGLLAKPMPVTLPFALLLFDFWPLRRWNFTDRAAWPRLIVEKLPLFALSVGSSVMTVLSQWEVGLRSLEVIPFPARLANALVAYVTYLWKTIWPAGLACFYPHRSNSAAGGPDSGFLLAALGAGVLLALLTFVLLRRGRRSPYLAMGWLWYLGTLVPVIGLVQVGHQALADRYTYLPLIGIYILVVWGALEWTGERPSLRPAFGAVAVVAIAAYAVASWIQVAHWRDGRALFERAIRVTEDNYVAHNNLGKLLASAGRNAEATQHLEDALRLRPNYAKAHNNLGNLLVAEGHLDEAVERYERAIALRPDDAEPHNNLGGIWARRGEPKPAERHYRESIRLDPYNHESHFNLAALLERQNRIDEAMTHYETAIRLEPGDPESLRRLATAMVGQGDLSRAIFLYEQALRLDASDARTHLNLGVTLQRANDPARAEAEYRRAIELAPGYHGAHLNLGLLLERQQRHRDAIGHLRKALEAEPPPLSAGKRLAWILSVSDDASLRSGEEALRLAEACARASGHRDPAALDVLAAAYAESGRFEEAVRRQLQAVESAPAELKDEYFSRLKSYREARPTRVPSRR